MSRDNVIAVAKTRSENKKSRYYVIIDLNMEMHFNKDYIKNLIKNFDITKQSTLDRGRALCIAHDYQKRLNTEYGVIEIDVF